MKVVSVSVFRDGNSAISCTWSLAAAGLSLNPDRPQVDKGNKAPPGIPVVNWLQGSRSHPASSPQLPQLPASSSCLHRRPLLLQFRQRTTTGPGRGRPPQESTAPPFRSRRICSPWPYVMCYVLPLFRWADNAIYYTRYIVIELAIYLHETTSDLPKASHGQPVRAGRTLCLLRS